MKFQLLAYMVFDEWMHARPDGWKDNPKPICSCNVFEVGGIKRVLEILKQCFISPSGKVKALLQIKTVFLEENVCYPNPAWSADKHFFCQTSIFYMFTPLNIGSWSPKPNHFQILSK